MSPRPWWMTALAVFCGGVLVATVPSDLFYPAARETEVWLGFELHGALARATAPIHWAIYAVGAWAFWTGRRWIVPWAVAYILYVAAAHLVWSEVSPHGRGLAVGLVEAIAIALVALLLRRTAANDARIA